MLNKRSVAMLLSRVPGFPKPKPRLEQYVTDSEVAAELVTRMSLLGLRRRVVADFGCGTGMLAYALALLNLASYIACIEIDPLAVRIARDFMRREGYDVLVDFVVSDALKPPLRSVNLVVMNPPFGIRSRRGLDIDFLKAGLSVADVIVSIHAWSDGLIGAVESKTGCKPVVLFEAWQRIPQFLEEHRRRIHRTRVVAILVSRERCRGF